MLESACYGRARLDAPVCPERDWLAYRALRKAHTWVLSPARTWCSLDFKDSPSPRRCLLSLTHSPEMHKNLIARIPSVTGLQLREWFSRLESGPAFLRCTERAHWLSDEHGLSHGYASAIVHEYEIQRRSRLYSA
jgi:Domain of unknown function (DUF4287)